MSNSLQQMLEKSSCFEIFGIQPQYIIDKISLKDKYIALCKQHHPDHSQIKGDHFSTVNQAYSTLKDDYSRAMHIYSLHNSEGLPNPSSDFLLNILELREIIETCDEIYLLKKIKESIEVKVQEFGEMYDDKNVLSRWKYFIRLKKLIEEKLGK